MIHFVTGDILESSVQIVVIPVNCVGISGKGLALEVKKRKILFVEQINR